MSVTGDVGDHGDVDSNLGPSTERTLHLTQVNSQELVRITLPANGVQKDRR
jgi:hypothetical protein